MSEIDNTIIPQNFIQDIVEKDLTSKKHQQVKFRFPPEPNGYLHLGHAKAICLNFGLAKLFNGTCNLRFDDTNPEKENEEYMTSIKEDISWLGFKWDALHYSSDYFNELYQMAVTLIKKKLAYIDSQTDVQIKETRGNLNAPGMNSPYRERSIDENLMLFEQMKKGQINTSNLVLRAKIDMSSPNMNLRDPIIYRVRNVAHYRTGSHWKIYPMYDFTHGQSDMLEDITHSLCTLEFEDHRPLYEWFIDHLATEHKPRQIEFSRLQLEYTILSKRNLIRLVEENKVDSWDDPRMPTIAGIRRRGIPSEIIRTFCNKVGITKKDAIIELSFLEGILREYLNTSSPRKMVVLDPLKVTITNYDKSELLSIANHPQNENMGSRKVSFSNTLYIEKEDFKESANKKFKRLVLGKEVRLRGSYVMRCDEVIKDKQGNPIELKCQIDPETLGKNPADGRKIKGVIHWVDTKTAVDATIINYDRLFKEKQPGKLTGNAFDDLNPNSKQVVNNAKIENSLSKSAEQQVFQFERTGYYVRDNKTSSSLCFNQTIGLRDNWS